MNYFFQLYNSGKYENQLRLGIANSTFLQQNVFDLFIINHLLFKSNTFVLCYYY